MKTTFKSTSDWRSLLPDKPAEASVSFGRGLNGVCISVKGTPSEASAGLRKSLLYSSEYIKIRDVHSTHKVQSHIWQTTGQRHHRFQCRHHGTANVQSQHTHTHTHTHTHRFQCCTMVELTYKVNTNTHTSTKKRTSSAFFRVIREFF